MKRFQYFLTALLFFFVGTVVGWSIPRIPTEQTTPRAETVQEAQVAHILFDEGDGVIKTFPNEILAEGETLFDLTKRLAERNNMTFVYDPPNQYGILITEIDSKKNGAGGAYWGYWVNAKLGEVAADQYKLQPGDVIEWKFVKLKM